MQDHLKAVCILIQLINSVFAFLIQLGWLHIYTFALDLLKIQIFFFF